MSSVAEDLKQLINRGAIEVPMLPEVANKALLLAQNPESDASEMARLIQGDQSLAGHVMRIANSAAYTPLSNLVSLQQAIARLGMSTISEIALAAAIGAKIFNTPGYEGYVADVWRHALATSLWAKEIARQRRSNVEVAFLAGLLHSIGRPAVLQTILELANKHGVKLSENDVRHMENSHCHNVSQAVVNAWRMPTLVVDAVSAYTDDNSMLTGGEHAGHINLGARFATNMLTPEKLDKDTIFTLPILENLNLYQDDVEYLLDKTDVIEARLEGLVTMSELRYDYDVLVIGSGPAGQKSAVQAAKAGKHVAIIERDSLFGGACVHRGTIPSKTLRENALRVKHMRQNAALSDFELAEDTEMITLFDRLDDVLKSHDRYMRKQIDRNNIERIHGRASFVDNHTIRLTKVSGEKHDVSVNIVVIAAGSYPRKPDNIPIDHEHIFDSDSILSMLYLPSSLTVLGGGVIASEYASIFQALGVKVTMIDRYPTPLGFLDEDMTNTFVKAFKKMGGTWMGKQNVEKVYWDGVSNVVTECEDGTVVRSQKLLCAAGRLANVKGLDLEKSGLALNEKGLISVDENLLTSVDNIYAAGDVIGPPSLASASMEQGRRAACNALGMEVGTMSQLIPAGIYSIPELSSVGLTEKQAREKYDNILVGTAQFSEVARGQISGNTEGMLKIVADEQGKKILGVMLVGEGSTEVVHIGQMAMLCDADVDIFVESTFNFPTLAEAYRIAALEILAQRPEYL